MFLVIGFDKIDLDFQIFDMERIKAKLSNCLQHLRCKTNINIQFQRILALVSLFQIISTVTHPSSLLHRITKWVEPSAIFQPGVAIILGSFSAFLFIPLFLLKLKLSTGSKMMGQSGACREFLNTMICYSLQVCKTVVAIPSVRGSLLGIGSCLSEPILFSLSVVNLIIYWFIIFPIALVADSNTTILTPNTNRYLTIFNTQILLDILRFILATCSISNTVPILLVSSLFVLTYVIVVIIRPITCFIDQQFKKALASTAAFCCLVRIFNQILQKPQGTFLIQFFGIFSCIATVQFLGRLKMKSILSIVHPQIYQIKLLLYLTLQSQKHLDLLQYFIIRHSRQCQESWCQCRKVVNNLIIHSSDLSYDLIWYEFLASYITTSFRINSIKKLAKTEIQAMTVKYSSVVFDLAELLLFKLHSPIKSYLTIREYCQHFKSQNLDNLWSRSKNKIAQFFLQKSICCLRREFDVFNSEADKAINLHADRYIQFQKQFCRQLQLMLASARKNEEFCMQMSRAQPDERVLTVLVGQINKQFIQIKRHYKALTANYQQCNQLIDPIISDYYKIVLNVSDNQPIHIFKSEKYFSLQTDKKPRKRRLNEDLHLFSYDSQTPMMIVSAEERHFGRIEVQNIFFKQLIALHLQKPLTSIDDLLIPQITQSHRKAVEDFRVSNQFKVQHMSTFFLGSRNQIIAVDLTIQIVLSIQAGLQYAVFVKNVMSERKIALLTNNFNVAYCSKSCELLLERNQDQTRRIKAFPKDLLQNINQLIPFRVGEQPHILKYHSRINTVLLYLEIIQEVSSQPAQTINEFSETQRQLRKTILKTNKSAKFMNDRQKKKINFSGNDFIEEKSQNQQRQEKKIMDLYKTLMGDIQGRKISRCTNIAIICLGVAIIGLLTTTMLYKDKEKETIYPIFQSSYQFQQLMKVLGDVSTALKKINLKAYKSVDANQMQTQLAQTASIYDLYKSSLSYFEMRDVEQTWKTLKFYKNGSIVPGRLGSFKAIPDLLQNPLDNLKEANISNFSFPLVYNQLVPPLTSTQTFFYDFLTNAIYFAIPNLRNFRFYQMIEMFTSELSKVPPYIILLLLVMVVMVLGFIPIFLLHRKVIKLMNYTHRFIEMVNAQVFRMKLRSCRNFVDTYCALSKEIDSKKSQRQILPNQNTVSEKGNSRNEMVEKNEVTEHQITPKTSAFCLEQIQRAPNPQSEQKDRNSQRIIARNQKEIFTPPSYKLLVIGYFLICTPLIACSSGLIVSSLSLKETMSILLQIQYGCGFVRSDLKLIELYSFHFGVYDYQLEQYNSIGKYLAQLIYTNFYIFQLLLTTVGQSIDIDGLEFFEKVQYYDLCRLQQQGFFVGFQNELVASRNYTQCSQISHGILNRGYVSAMLNYLEAANNLFLNNLYTVMYNQTQKLAYLSCPFFTENARSLDYLDMVFSQFIAKNRQNLDTFIWNEEILFVSICLSLIIFCLILLVFLRKYYIKQQHQHIQYICTIFTLVSCQTVLSQQRLREDFLNARDDLEDLK